MATPKTTDLDAKVAQYSYEEARSQLVDVVARLEQGNIPLAEAMDLWELGEALARRCQEWLSSARERLDQAQAANAESGEEK